MNGKLKALGLATMAILALGAVAASSASAQLGKLTSDGPVTLTGNDTGAEANSFTAFGSTVSCPNSTYTGHAVKTEEQTHKTFTETGQSHELLPSGATEITVTPHYLQTSGGTANCDVTGGQSMTITMNGCDYRYYDFTTDGTGGYTFLTDIVCPPGKSIETHVYLAHGHSGSVCTMTIPGGAPNAGLTGGKAANTVASHHIDLTGTVTVKTIHKEGLCGSQSGEGTQKIDVTIKGHNAEGSPTGVTISD